MSAPVNDPSPPITTSASIPFLIRFTAASSLPALVLNVVDLALPITVPPYLFSKAQTNNTIDNKPRTSSHPSSLIFSGGITATNLAYSVLPTFLD